ncbi:unnamed protein product, partial [Rotaria sp. Silwood1]
MGCSRSVPADSSHSQHHPKTIIPSLSSSPIMYRKSNNIVKRNHRAQPHEIVQNFLILWLDEDIDEVIDEYYNSIQHLQQIVNTIEPFNDTDECVDYLSQLQNEKAFLIVSDTLCETVVPRIHHMTQLYSIYVFSHKQSGYEEWAKDWYKVKGVFTEIIPLSDSIRQCARHCDEDLVVISAVSSLNELESSFVYIQLFKEIILGIDFNEKKEINALVEYAHEKYADNDEHLKMINEFAREYRGNLDGNNKPIWWYTRECFAYHMLNRALGTLQVETLFRIGIFIRDLHRNIEKLHSEQSNDIHGSTTPITVYR